MKSRCKEEAATDLTEALAAVGLGSAAPELEFSEAVVETVEEPSSRLGTRNNSSN